MKRNKFTPKELKRLARFQKALTELSREHKITLLWATVEIDYQVGEYVTTASGAASFSLDWQDSDDPTRVALEEGEV